MQECSVHSLLCLLFPWVQCQSLKPVLSQCSQTGFVTVDDFIALYTRSCVFYSHGCNKFLHARTFFTLADTIPPIFRVITEVWPCPNQAMVTNNSTMIIEVVLIKAMLIEGFLYTSLIHPYLSYGVEAWHGTYQNNTSEMFVLQKKAICAINNIAYNEHTNAYFKCNKILKLSDQYKLQVLNYIFQVLHYNIDEEMELSLKYAGWFSTYPGY